MDIWRGDALPGLRNGPIVNSIGAWLDAAWLECADLLVESKLALGRYRVLVGFVAGRAGPCERRAGPCWRSTSERSTKDDRLAPTRGGASRLAPGCLARATRVNHPRRSAGQDRPASAR
ncbi:BTAD domain-containing putative transcriptional regulator [Kutzneria sp. 744]|uniref:BTAD domain-containing putative transcriptional regulator n=1 Tax=Kutzneria sp. (strain 744) TaxID=345341 RepID=UPI00350EE43F